MAQDGEEAREAQLVGLDAGRGVGAQDADLDAVVDAVKRGGDDDGLVLVAPGGGDLEGVADGVVREVEAAGDGEAVDAGGTRRALGVGGRGRRAQAAVGVGDEGQ